LFFKYKEDVGRREKKKLDRQHLFVNKNGLVDATGIAALFARGTLQDYAQYFYGFEISGHIGL